MIFDSALTKGILVKRYKRFLADVELEDGSIVTAHCANSGSMMGLIDAGNTVYLLPNTNPKAKLDWRWEIVVTGETLVGINTARPNYIVKEAIENGIIKQLQGYENLRMEVKYDVNSRIDILLENALQPSCYVEVKNATLSRNTGIAEFPDAVTARGAKHLHALSNMVEQGHRAVMVYLVNRADCNTFCVAKDIDSAYYAALQQAKQAGVEAYAYYADVTDTAIEITSEIPIQM